MLSKKHFDQLAAQFAKTQPNIGSPDVVDALTAQEYRVRVERHRQWDIDVVAVADVLSASSPRFDRARFYRACGVEVPHAAVAGPVAKGYPVPRC